MQEDKNKQTVLSFYKNVIASRDETAIAAYIHPQYKQHSPQLKDGPQGLHAAIMALKQMPVQPQDRSPIKLVLASGDLVGMYMVLGIHGRSMAVADLFRLQDGMIMEHWDASCELPQEPVPGELVVRKEKDALTLTGPLDTGILLSLLRYENREAHRVIIEGNYAMVQSSGADNGLRFVSYEFIYFNGKEIEKRFSIEQEIPAVSANGNGMI